MVGKLSFEIVKCEWFNGVHIKRTVVSNRSAAYVEKARRDHKS